MTAANVPPPHVAPPSPPPQRYPVRLHKRVVKVDVVKPGYDAAVFDTPQARAINQARMDHLFSLGLNLAGRSVLDVGCGVGHLAQGFVQRQCQVTCIDGRAANIERLGALYPDLGRHAAVIDVQRQPLQSLGMFDIVLCYGLLYHLEDPLAGLRHMAEVCGDLMLLETVICDCDQPVVRLIDEYASWNQALTGIGTRLSPAYVAFALNRIGFEHVYAPHRPPQHPDFLFDWRNNLDVERDGRLLRCVFIASRRPIDLPTLYPLLQDEAPRSRGTDQT